MSHQRKHVQWQVKLELFFGPRVRVQLLQVHASLLPCSNYWAHFQVQIQPMHLDIYPRLSPSTKTYTVFVLKDI